MTGTVQVDPAVMGWQGEIRLMVVREMTPRLSAAIAQRAAELGITADGTEPADEPAGTANQIMIRAGTPQTWLAADKLCAYIDGLRDALDDSYGNPPVEVGRRDLRLALRAVGSYFHPDAEVAAAVARLKKALGD